MDFLSWTLTTMGGLGVAGLASTLAPKLAHHVVPPVRRERLRDHIGFDRCVTNTVVRCVDGTLIATIGFHGNAVSTRTDEAQDKLYLDVKLWVEQLARCQVTVRVISRRRAHDMGVDCAGYEDPWLRRVHEAWADTFTNAFDVDHTIVLSIGPGIDGARKQLDDAITLTLRSLRDFKPYLLEMGEAGEISSLKSFWGSLLNPGAHVRFRASTGAPTADRRLIAPVDRRLADDLIRTQVLFEDTGPSDGVITFRRGTEVLYGAMLGLTTWGNETSSETLGCVLKTEAEVVICQIFRPFDKIGSRAVLEVLRKNNAASARTESQIQTMLQVLDQPDGPMSGVLCKHQVSILVYAASRPELARRLAEIEETLDEDSRTGCVRMTDEAEPTWFQMFPPHGDMTASAKAPYQVDHARPMIPASMNVAHLVNLETPPRGLDRVPRGWGGEPPRCIVRSAYGSPYAITFHKEATDDGNKPVGNALIIGGQGSGKTVALNWICGAYLGHPNVRVFMTDRYDGGYVWTQAIGGRYIHLSTDKTAVGEVAELAPLQMQYEVRADGSFSADGEFLLRWLRDHLANIDDPAAEQELRRALITNATLAPEHQNLEEFSGAINHPALKRAFSRWTRGGAYPSTFNGRRDSLDFTNGVRWNTFDFTRAVSDETLIRALIPYLQYRIETSMLNAGAPWILALDEAAAMVTEPAIAKWYMVLNQEVRKNLGVVVSCYQRASSVAEMGSSVREALMINSPLKIVFCNAEADRDEYCEILGLSAAEFDFVRRQHRFSRTRRYAALVKKDGEGAVMVDFDLSALQYSQHGNLLSLFESGSDAANRLRGLIRERGRAAAIEAYVGGKQLAAPAPTALEMS